MADAPLAARPASHVCLQFSAAGADRASKDSDKSLSAVQSVGKTLWLAGDESSSIERLTSDDRGNYAEHRSFDLSRYFELPGKPGEEVDIEGLACDEETRRLWLVGSHSYRRAKVKRGMSDDEALAALSYVDRQANRYLLGYLQFDADLKDITAEPSKGFALPFGKESSELVDAIRENATYAPFLDLPSKDNGFDIEGLAVANSRVFVGLRGPVLRGWATVLQLATEVIDNSTLNLSRRADGKHDLVQHVLNLGGLGIRDLCPWNENLLILAGPTMELDGPMRVFLWRNAFVHDRSRRIDGNQIEWLFDIPYGDRHDHAEGIAVVAGQGTDARLLVVYDSPGKERLHDGACYDADLFRL
ncbi:hypothetical protein A9R05_33035 (plasmid) [Burkholderia sp. KK1]|nr:hypothetical protein A9R05_33035 [Burkholderia sp. KK1]